MVDRGESVSHMMSPSAAIKRAISNLAVVAAHVSYRVLQKKTAQTVTHDIFATVSQSHVIFTKMFRN